MNVSLYNRNKQLVADQRLLSMPKYRKLNAIMLMEILYMHQIVYYLPTRQLVKFLGNFYLLYW